MAGYNRIIIMGNLTRDPEYQQLPSGQAVCRLGLASNRQYKNKQTGAMVQEVCFIDADVFGAQAESSRQFLQKGRAVLVEGRLKFDTWETQDGQKRNKYSIVADRVVFLSAGGANAENEAGERSVAQRSSKPAMSAQAAGNVDDIDVDYDEEPASRKKAPKKAGELEFKDEPPFQDDLPF
ncbi:MAG: Single-stranded DNA-binding protein [Candidatus Dependentiae bacterium ADurb.Bin331]|nr:MAG: Single-stranded DNA-binding protein [Candidatus Dependentiae bacterium ADurb.Bin331]